MTFPDGRVQANDSALTSTPHPTGTEQPLLGPPSRPAPVPGWRLTRRGMGTLAVLGVAAGGAVVAPTLLRLAGSRSSASEPDPENPTLGEGEGCVDSGSLKRTSSIGPATLVYELNGKTSSMGFNPSFHAQLERWLADWNATSRYRGVKQIWSYGAHVNKDNCQSWHASGRAFDISRLRAGNTLLVSARTDLWHDVSAEQQTNLRRRYWTLAASLHLHFAYVLTHHFDTLHANHLHIDNGVSGAGMSTFNPKSRVQNQAVQAICSSVWGRPGAVTGEWGDARKQVAPVLADLGVKDLTKQASWQAFLRASVAKG